AAASGDPASGGADDGRLDRQLGLVAAAVAAGEDSRNGDAERPRGLPPEKLREAMSPIPGAVTVVTTTHDRGPHATTVSAFSSLSSDPPLVMIALDRSSDLLGKLEPGGRFAVNLLSAGQEEVGRACALKGPDKLATVPWHEADGLPRIDGAAGWLTCDVHALFPGGDHVIVVGLVTGCESADETSALVYHRRRFLDFVPSELLKRF
ncbi:MAG: flavin reductase family protein, partial [Actinomycetota bacterium]|nr:flavin reductase family protein [Actinomycetota bacterium]